MNLLPEVCKGKSCVFSSISSVSSTVSKTVVSAERSEPRAAIASPRQLERPRGLDGLITLLVESALEKRTRESHPLPSPRRRQGASTTALHSPPSSGSPARG
jgi:hypothetical protein